MHRRVGALWIAAGRLANEIWLVSQLNLAPFSGAKMGYTFSFMSTFEKYRDCRLVARQERRGWRVWISETRYRSSLQLTRKAPSRKPVSGSTPSKLKRHRHGPEAQKARSTPPTNASFACRPSLSGRRVSVGALIVALRAALSFDVPLL